MDETGMNYVARKACGCIVAASADEPDMKADNANDVALWIRAGYTVERVADAEVRERWTGRNCPHDKQPALL